VTKNALALTADELTAVLEQRLPKAAGAQDGGIAHVTAISTVVRITGGDFRLVDRLVTRIQRNQALNRLTDLTPEVVDAARESLLIGHE
jgi:hypothetical protein